MTAQPAFPKPVRRAPKPRKPMQRKARLEAKRWGVSHGPSKTAHARRPRDFARMAFLSTLPCGVHEAFYVVAGRSLGLELPGPCSGRTEVMHLGWKADPGGRRRANDTDTAPGCSLHHAETGTKLGGLGRWYVALGRDGQRAFRAELASRATELWNGLSDEAKQHWREIADAGRTTR